MKRIYTILFVLLIISCNITAQQTVDLWEGSPPTDNGITTPEIIETGDGWYRIANISKPSITIYSPVIDKNTGMAVLICPGGGYGSVAVKHEGEEFAKWLNSIGITGVILKYRMPNKHKEVPLDDVWQAMRYIRKNAKELHINVNKVGIAGFSAGGHLAATASTFFSVDSVNTRPDFSILFYAVTIMDSTTHKGSMLNLLGDNPLQEDLKRFSPAKQINENTPPAILFISSDDTAVSPKNSIDYYWELKKNNICSALYIFPSGDHGWGMNDDFAYHNQMLSLLEAWLGSDR